MEILNPPQANEHSKTSSYTKHKKAYYDRNKEELIRINTEIVTNKRVKLQHDINDNIDSLSVEKKIELLQVYTSKYPNIPVIYGFITCKPKRTRVKKTLTPDSGSSSSKGSDSGSTDGGTTTPPLAEH